MLFASAHSISPSVQEEDRRWMKEAFGRFGDSFTVIPHPYARVYMLDDAPATVRVTPSFRLHTSDSLVSRFLHEDRISGHPIGFVIPSSGMRLGNQDQVEHWTVHRHQRSTSYDSRLRFKTGVPEMAETYRAFAAARKVARQEAVLPERTTPLIVDLAETLTASGLVLCTSAREKIAALQQAWLAYPTSSYLPCHGSLHTQAKIFDLDFVCKAPILWELASVAISLTSRLDVRTFVIQSGMDEQLATVMARNGQVWIEARIIEELLRTIYHRPASLEADRARAILSNDFEVRGLCRKFESHSSFWRTSSVEIVRSAPRIVDVPLPEPESMWKSSDSDSGHFSGIS